MKLTYTSFSWIDETKENIFSTPPLDYTLKMNGNTRVINFVDHENNEHYLEISETTVFVRYDKRSLWLDINKPRENVLNFTEDKNIVLKWVLLEINISISQIDFSYEIYQGNTLLTTNVILLKFL
ncbi:hypothetical protein [Metamycoplasma hyosynoviae]|uniref:Uncharacterized protein n=2 Tax=Metamycoplasma hyosynoviae TaxID=29559 RepID=A0A4P1QFR5_9BACT|nr:hypothetical protein [Metamycoplasma hyosynoviae]ASI53708.1 hypothetical protein MHSN_00535 [Metamycoplasma hyosynoviae]MDC8899989.1 hypothetical protein [Metamycoplasma hyosynoviae]MDC8911590.1 hypothetical protein [Metamycoplasma hyosynoviae]MDC8913705.1 hypothetical protein [Metamycoplasma hyosynoviae]MDC8916772.1 hypothetical protein [Metamycoplasma hyosynoviae]